MHSQKSPTAPRSAMANWRAASSNPKPCAPSAQRTDATHYRLCCPVIASSAAMAALPVLVAACRPSDSFWRWKIACGMAIYLANVRDAEAAFPTQGFIRDLDRSSQDDHRAFAPEANGTFVPQRRWANH